VPSTVGTTTVSGAIIWPFQRKCFYANGRFWVFFTKGGYMGYCSSPDGINWSSFTNVRSLSYGYMFSVWFDGYHVHYVVGNNSPLYYRKGIPNPDGSITWLFNEISISTRYNYVSFPYIAVDDQGYVWVGYADYDIYGTTYTYPYVIRFSVSDSTPTIPSDFPKQLSTLDGAWAVSVIPVPNGRALIIYARGNDYLRAVFWDGQFSSGVRTATPVYASQYHSAIYYNNYVHIVFLDVNYSIRYVKYDISSKSFTAEEVLVSNATSYSAPVISLDESKGNLYVFAATKTTNSPPGWLAEHIYYRKYKVSQNVWEGWVDFVNEESLKLNSADSLTSFYKTYNGYIGLAYLASISSPYYVRFALLSTRIPTVLTLSITPL